MKRVHFICVASAIVLILAALTLRASRPEKDENLKVGFIYVGDEMTPYTENFVLSQQQVQEKYGDRLQCITKYNVPEDECEETILELAKDKCDLIVAASYGYETCMKDIAAKYPDIQFCVPTGDNANTKPVLDNYHNCMGTIYQGRYICGVVAGMKIREMMDEGIIDSSQAKVGYVAAFPYAEVISGYTSFFLGVSSIVPEATMEVKYTNTWSNYSIEKRVAGELIDRGCVIISQHSDTTGPAFACEKSNREIPVYHVGYNQSMTAIAPTKSLVSCNIDYTPYLDQAIGALLEGRTIESNMDAKVCGQDVMAGLDKEWIRILDINKAVVAEGTREKVDEITNQLISGRLTVFKGPYTGTNPYDEKDTIDLNNGFIENESSSSPTFHYVLDDVIQIIP